MSKYIKENIDFIKKFDPEIAKSINLEFNRQSNNLELIASENIVSSAVLAAMGSILTNKYVIMEAANL